MYIHSATHCSVFVLMYRNDWNLLSTATPAINSWMNPCHRAIQASDILYGRLSKRVCTVMACIMTEALDHQRLHMPHKVSFYVLSASQVNSRFNNITSVLDYSLQITIHEIPGSLFICSKHVLPAYTHILLFCVSQVVVKLV